MLDQILNKILRHIWPQVIALLNARENLKLLIHDLMTYV